MNVFSVWTPQPPALVGLVLLRSDGTFYNFRTSGWDQANADALPPSPDNLLFMVRALPMGVFGGNWFAQFGDVASPQPGVVTIPVSCDAQGKILSQLDQYVVQWVNYATGTMGGYSQGLGGGFYKTG